MTSRPPHVDMAIAASRLEAESELERLLLKMGVRIREACGRVIDVA